MATMKVKFRASSVETKEGTLFYQVIHNRVARQITTGYKLFPKEWNDIGEYIVVPDGISEYRRNYLFSLKEVMEGDIARMNGIITRLERAGEAYTTDKVMEIYNSQISRNGFMSFTDILVKQLERIGKKRTAETYMTVLNSFVRFRREIDIPIDKIDSKLMMEYESFLKSTGVCPNTISFYMRNLRAIYNRLVEEDITMQRYPFKHVYTGIEKTVKRAVPLEVIRQLKKLELTLEPSFDYARDMFMFSFYTRGMSFVDMAFLKKKNLQNGILIYRRQKTSRKLYIKWERPMQEIVSKYDTSRTPYLLPIIRNMEMDERKQYRNSIHLINSRLKRLGERLKLSVPLTSYVARHAWASIAKSKNVAISVISEAMGHDSENTTRIYLAQLDTTVVDKANSLILNSL